MEQRGMRGTDTSHTHPTRSLSCPWISKDGSYVKQEMRDGRGALGSDGPRCLILRSRAMLADYLTRWMRAPTAESFSSMRSYPRSM